MGIKKGEIKIFDADDKSLKLLGELLSNDTSRKIIKALIKQEMYTNEISTKLDIRVSLVIHHLKKLEELDLVVINHKKIVKKGNEHRYFRMVPGFYVMPNCNKEEMKAEDGILKKIFKEGVKFSSIILTAGFVWKSGILNFESTDNYPVPFGSPVVEHLDPIVPALIIIIIGLIVERIFFTLKKRKRG